MQQLMHTDSWAISRAIEISETTCSMTKSRKEIERLRCQGGLGKLQNATILRKKIELGYWITWWL